MDADASITGVLDDYIQPDDEFIISREGNIYYVYICLLIHVLCMYIHTIQY